MTYALPTPAMLRMTYPAFSDATAFPDATIQFWLDKVVGKDVDQGWPDYGQDAQIAAAAHRMTRAGLLKTDGTDDLTGVSDFRSAQFQVKFSDAYLAQQTAGGWESTQAGQDYLELLERYAAGPRVTSPGVAPCGYGYNGFAGPLPGYLG